MARPLLDSSLRKEEGTILALWIIGLFVGAQSTQIWLNCGIGVLYLVAEAGASPVETKEGSHYHHEARLAENGLNE